MTLRQPDQRRYAVAFHQAIRGLDVGCLSLGGGNRIPLAREYDGQAAGPRRRPTSSRRSRRSPRGGVLLRGGPAGLRTAARLGGTGAVLPGGGARADPDPARGDRIKTDRRDVRKLAELLRGDLLTAVHAPTPVKQEAVRDLCRAREAVKRDQTRGRHRLSKFLLRRGSRWTVGRKMWTRARGHGACRRFAAGSPRSTAYWARPGSWSTMATSRRATSESSSSTTQSRCGATRTPGSSTARGGAQNTPRPTTKITTAVIAVHVMIFRSPSGL